MCTRPRAVLLTALLCGFSLFSADFNMKVTDNGYLDTQGFSVILYRSTFDCTFVDQRWYSAQT